MIRTCEGIRLLRILCLVMRFRIKKVILLTKIILLGEGEYYFRSQVIILLQRLMYFEFEEAASKISNCKNNKISKIMIPASKEIIISSDSFILDIQQAFNFYYPFLRIEFAEKVKDSSPYKNRKISSSSLVRQIAELVVPAKINIEGERSVAEIEKDFKDLLGLQLKVYRKSGNIWNLISVTENWTLESQNKAGEFISIEMAAAS
jgi:hypothetical protein